MNKEAERTGYLLEIKRLCEMTRDIKVLQQVYTILFRHVYKRRGG